MEGPIRDICYYCLPWVQAPFLGGKHPIFLGDSSPLVHAIWEEMILSLTLESG